MNQAHTWSEPDLYLLVDEDLIESAKNAKRRLCTIEKHPAPVIVPDKPWEGKVSEDVPNTLQDPLYGTVLWDPVDGIFRCWYNAYDRLQNRSYAPNMANQGYSCCLALSKDGINWEKPDLGRALYQGSPANNILRFKDQPTSGSCNLGEQIWNVLPYGAPDSGDRFLASLYTHFSDPLYSSGITMCYSPDGIDWRMDFPPSLPSEGDCHGMSWDPKTGCYILTTRSHEHGVLARKWGRNWKRHIALFQSRDLVHWTAAHTILEADDKDPEDAQLYLMYVIPYGHLYLGQLLMFYGTELLLDVQLAMSRDMHNWKRTSERKPILERGDEGAWDCKHVALMHNPPDPEGDVMRFWYGGKDRPHYQAGYAAIGTGTLRRDGFACYESVGDKEGVVTTIPFHPPTPGRSTWVILNVDATDGEVLVEITDVDGKPIEGVTKADCIPIRGDHTRALVNFKAAPTDYFSRGNFLRFWQDIRYRFHLRNAKLYAFKAPELIPQWP